MMRMNVKLWVALNNNEVRMWNARVSREHRSAN